MTAPLLLTSLRIAAIPILVVVLLSDIRGKEIASFLIFSLATLTDLLDGFWARRKNQTTVLGQLLDPMADKLLIASVLICLVEFGSVPAWMAVIIIGREIAITGFRAMASARGIHIPASRLGKLKMGLETWTILLLLLGPRILGSAYGIARISLWLTIALALASAAEYYLRYGKDVISGQAS